jgi:hypothetical protein
MVVMGSPFVRTVAEERIDLLGVKRR